MATTPKNNGGDGDDLSAIAASVVTEVRRVFDHFVKRTPGLDQSQAQLVIFAEAAKRLAQDGVPLGEMLRQTARVYGVVIEDLEITDDAGRTLVKHGKETDDAETATATTRARTH